jgi:hypothetical protein
MSAALAVWLEGVGLLAPGLPNWAAAKAVLAGREAYVHAPTVIAPSDLLPAAERRRAGLPVKITLAAGQAAFADAGRDPGSAATVFSSSSGDGENLHRICESLVSEEREISPTRFHNSVHNAPAGYWSIAVGAREASTSLCGHDASFAVGLIDAAAQAAAENTTVALITSDQPYPEPLDSVRHIAASVGIALVLTPQATPKSQARLLIELVPDDGQYSVLAEPRLEEVRLGVPAARGLPLLAAVAALQGGSATVDLQYTGALKLRVRVSPAEGA